MTAPARDADSTAKTIIGRAIKLDGGRLVFLADADAYGRFKIGFVSRDGKKLTFNLSREALDALCSLHQDAEAGSIMPFPDPKIERIWAMIAAAAEDAT